MARSRQCQPTLQEAYSESTPFNLCVFPRATSLADAISSSGSCSLHRRFTLWNPWHRLALASFCPPFLWLARRVFWSTSPQNPNPPFCERPQLWHKKLTRSVPLSTSRRTEPFRLFLPAIPVVGKTRFLIHITSGP